jgi:acetolactate synthase regulatory subunit
MFLSLRSLPTMQNQPSSSFSGSQTSASSQPAPQNVVASELKRTVICTAQAKLGALDRILGAFTHRGFIPTAMTTELQAGGKRIRVAVSFTCDDSQTVEKLVRFLRKQVHCIEVEAFTCNEATKQENSASASAKKSTSNSITSKPGQRLIANVVSAANKAAAERASLRSLSASGFSA